MYSARFVEYQILPSTMLNTMETKINNAIPDLKELTCNRKAGTLSCKAECEMLYQLFKKNMCKFGTKSYTHVISIKPSEEKHLFGAFMDE